MLNVACWNSFVIWMINNPGWNRANLAKRRVFLKELAETLMMPLILQRSLQQKLRTSVRTVMELYGVKPPQEEYQWSATRSN